LLLHYTIEMRPGLRIPGAPLRVSVPFGTRPDPRRIELDLPEGATSWELWESSGSGTLASKAADGSAAIDATFQFLWAGQFTHTYTVAAWGPPPSGLGGNVQFLVPLVVEYEVTANPGVPIAAAPEQPSVHHVAAGSCEPVGNGFWWRYQDTRTDSTPVAVSVVYDSAPAAASDHPNRESWLWLEPYWHSPYTVHPCLGVNPLPPGTYDARIHFAYGSGESAYATDLPVQMVIDP